MRRQLRKEQDARARNRRDLVSALNRNTDQLDALDVVVRSGVRALTDSYSTVRIDRLLGSEGLPSAAENM